ncbi:MAG: TniQ family protein [Crocosphaera sp.]|nr:TniQ family protein [Crocosphaera sp.]
MKSKVNFQPPWILEPYEGESISHYLGRYCRHESVSLSALGKAAGIGSVLGRWEKFRFIPFPSEEELEAVGELIGLSVAQLEGMLPQEPMKLLPIRLCSLCYAEKPYHRMEWQYQSQFNCSKHGVKLLTKCPSCRQRFAIPSHWVEGRCQRCGMAFKRMDR